MIERHSIKSTPSIKCITYLRRYPPNYDTHKHSEKTNQSTPFDEAQFKRFLQDILGGDDVAIARDNLPTELHEATEEFSRLHTTKHPSGHLDFEVQVSKSEY